MADWNAVTQKMQHGSGRDDSDASTQHEAVRNVMRYIRSVYGAQRFTIDEARFLTWADQLRDIEPDALSAGVRRACQGNANPPTPAEVRQAARAEAGQFDNQSRAPQRWRRGEHVTTVPVSVWDTSLEVLMLLAMGGEPPQARSACNAMEAMHGSVDNAIDTFIAQVEAAPIGLKGTHHPLGVRRWRELIPDMRRYVISNLQAGR